ncbi:hypothetical protein BCR41DRAFT_244455 [Lobosporangium transversale]|uniref:Myosin N-terminal SH3-like domain-containing protein n=1 Tax=Lobosporangium transversale TaxID=64571 RepID=A0A1Y2GU09_9FUNG|nr:hypothetical protein BCR41DRAFT_244455 [Lobosporangium transversale]ORZ23708.1 hypothetical protein BCR41DRAFT_244455 [Lobosporangium transversale]|eukprot:XP_021883522.1 hypothetical protein BCR41DRAFT_244455 [Lobosporangium transversale]
MVDAIAQRAPEYRGLAVDAVAQAAFNEKKWVWVEDKEEGYIAGWISKEDGDQVEVHLNNGLVRTVNINQTGKMNPPKFDKVEDMADLTYLNEASVVHNLRLRYHSNLIYVREEGKGKKRTKAIERSLLHGKKEKRKKKSSSLQRNAIACI